jgi:Ni/Fe-hydrogenase subunit HybB-like protein
MILGIRLGIIAAGIHPVIMEVIMAPVIIITAVIMAVAVIIITTAVIQKAITANMPTPGVT